MERGIVMSTIERIIRVALGVVLILAAAGCADLSECERDTAVGAAIGGVAGSVVTEGSTAGTVGGAVAGGLIGNRSAHHRC